MIWSRLCPPQGARDRRHRWVGSEQWVLAMTYPVRLLNDEAGEILTEEPHARGILAQTTSELKIEDGAGGVGEVARSYVAWGGRPDNCESGQCGLTVQSWRRENPSG